VVLDVRLLEASDATIAELIQLSPEYVLLVFPPTPDPAGAG